MKALHESLGRPLEAASARSKVCSRFEPGFAFFLWLDLVAPWAILAWLIFRYR